MKSVQLASLIPAGIFVGTSLIIGRGDRFLFGIRPQKQEGDRQVLELTGIGGAMEEEDASYMAGAQREAQEEIGCTVRISPSDETLIVRDGKTVDKVHITGHEQPVAIVFRNHRTPAHEPWHPENQGQACLLVFLAELAGKPTPNMELPSLIWLLPEQIAATARRDISLGHLLESGAKLIGGPHPAPMNGQARLTDSQEALALALDSQAVAFYRSLG